MKLNSADLFSTRITSSQSDSTWNNLIHGEVAIARVGGHHLFQVLAAILIFYGDSTGNRVGYSLPFMESDRIDLLCYDKQTGNLEGRCSVEEACHSGLYNFSYANTGLINWRVTYNKACLSDDIFSLMGSCYFAGYFTGSLIFIPLSDYWGRKWIVVSGMLLQAFMSAVILLWHNFSFLYAYEFFLGLKMPMTSHLMFIWLSEFLSMKQRSVFTIVGVSFVALNNVWISLYFKYVGVWQYWYLANIGQILVISLLVGCWVPESARNLLARRKYDQARKVFRRIASINKKPMFSQQFIGEGGQSTSLLSSEISVAKKTKCTDLFRQDKRHVALLFVIPALWLVGDMSFYGIQYGLDHLNGSIYTNGLLLGCADFFCHIVATLMSTFWGRKPALILFWICEATGCFCYEFINSSVIIGYVSVAIARMGANGGFLMMFLITTETFPTVYRGRVYGISNAIARVGGILAPMIPDLVPHFMVFQAGLGVIGLGLSFVLIETRNKRMEDDFNLKPRLSSLEEGEIKQNQ